MKTRHTYLTCPSCGGPLETALVGLDDEIQICEKCGYEEGDDIETEEGT